MAQILFYYSEGREVIKDIRAVHNKSVRRIKRKYYENHENTSCFVYTEFEVSVYHFFYKFAILLLFGLATLILMMIQIQALAD